MAGDASSASMTNKNGQQLFTDIKTEDEGIEFYASAQHPKLNLSMRNLGDAVTAKLAKAFTEVFAVSSGATPRITLRDNPCRVWDQDDKVPDDAPEDFVPPQAWKNPFRIQPSGFALAGLTLALGCADI